MSNVISENTKVKLSFIVLLMGAITTALTWVGTIQADVGKLKEDRIDQIHKIDSIKENVDYIRGLLDSQRRSKK